MAGSSSSNRRPFESSAITVPPSDEDRGQPSTKRLMPAGEEGTTLFEHLTCGICLQLYDSPKLLPTCPHIFCLKCLKQLPQVKFNDFLMMLRCPQCQNDCIIGPGGLEGLQTHFPMQQAVFAVQAGQRMMQGGAAVRSGECFHAFADESGQSTCPHCQKQFCPNCRLSHAENVKVEALQAADQFLKKCEDLNVEKRSSDLRNSLYSAMTRTEVSMNTMANTFRNVLESLISTSIAQYKDQLQNTFNLKLPLLLQNIQQLGAQSNMDALKVAQNEVRTKPLDLGTLAHFHGAVKTKDNELTSILRLIEQPPVLQLKVNPEAERLMEALGKVSLFVVAGNVPDLPRQVIPQPEPKAIIEQPLPPPPPPSPPPEKPKPKRARQKAVAKKPPPLPTGPINDVFNGEIKSLTAVQQTGIFVLFHGSDKAACLDRSGKIVGQAKIPQDRGYKQHELGYLYSGDGDFAYYQTKAIEMSRGQYHHMKFFGRLDFTENVAEPKIERVSLSTFGGDWCSKVVAVKPWDTVIVLESWCSLVAYVPSGHLRFKLTDLGSRSFLHGLVDVTDEKCHLLCSASGRLALVPVFWMPFGPGKQFQSPSYIQEKHYLQLPWAFSSGKNPVYLFHGKRQFAVVVNSNLQVFEFDEEFSNVPKLIAQFTHSGFNGCKYFAILHDGDKISETSKLTAAVVTSKKTIHVFQVPTEA